MRYLMYIFPWVVPVIVTLRSIALPLREKWIRFAAVMFVAFAAGAISALAAHVPTAT
jgi:hypothetical protein